MLCAYLSRSPLRLATYHIRTRRFIVLLLAHTKSTHKTGMYSASNDNRRIDEGFEFCAVVGKKYAIAMISSCL